MATKIIQFNQTDNIGQYITEFRERQAWSQEYTANKLGVSRVTVVRWEKGEVQPSILAIKQLENLINSLEVSGSNIKLEILEKEPKKKKTTTPKSKYKIKQFTPAPYVLNGPKDQNNFHTKLIELQLSNPKSKDYKTRLSLVQEIDGQSTSQYKLESPKTSAKSWSSNYGSNGWHRYVGRFPPHVVRGLLNYFGAEKNDIICDPFLGSGTTLVESRLLGIPAVGIEICPLSCMISRTKTNFPHSTKALKTLTADFENFYNSKWKAFQKLHPKTFTHQDILKRSGNNINTFANIERWFTASALLGVSITTEFAQTKKGYARDFILTALSSKMRSIGNVDVDVIRAEYSKSPRKDVDVLKSTRQQMLKMIDDIEAMIDSHSQTLDPKILGEIKEGSVLNIDFPKNSISHIITSPPYGVESLSYLRTHLLSYRSLGHFLKRDPYGFSADVIGSEYLPKEPIDISKLTVTKISKKYRNFFKNIGNFQNKAHQIRVVMMMKFFEDMNDIVQKFQKWLKPGGKIAFVIGNKRIDNKLIPTHEIMDEIFKAHGFKSIELLAHKLKTNNSNSRVPWQDKIIDQEFIMIFEKR